MDVRAWVVDYFFSPVKDQVDTGAKQLKDATQTALTMASNIVPTESREDKLKTYQEKVQPIIDRHMARKAGQRDFVHRKEQTAEERKLRSDILVLVSDLNTEISDLSVSRLHYFYHDKIRIKMKKCAALNALLATTTSEEFRNLAVEQRKDIEIVSGKRSRTEKLLVRACATVIEDPKLKKRRWI